MNVIHSGDADFVERRQTRRVEAAHEVTVRIRGRFAVTGTTADLSPIGARIDGAGPFPTGSEMWIRLPGLDSQSGRVAWSRHGATGLAFEHALHPAAYARFVPAESRLTLVSGSPHPAPRPAEIVAMPRTEQIARGYGAAHFGPLRSAKEPKGSGLFGAISRAVPRQVEHRREERFADRLRTGPKSLNVGHVESEVRDVSSSGLRVACPIALEIGSNVPVEFEGFDTIPGRVVWRRDGEMGLSLPDDALALDDA